MNKWFGRLCKRQRWHRSCVNYLLNVPMKNKDIRFRLNEVNQMSEFETYQLYEETAEKLGTGKEAEEYCIKWCRISM